MTPATVRRWRRRWRRLWVPGALLLSLPILTGCVRHFAEEKASDRINELLPRYLGPAKSYRTRVESDGAVALLRGHVHAVHIQGEQVQLQPDLTVEALTLDFAEVSVDPRAGRLQSVGNAAFSCRMTGPELDHYVRTLRTNIPDLHVSLEEDRVLVTAKPHLIGIGAPVSVDGTLVPVPGGTNLNFEPDRAKLAFVPVPQIVLSYIAERLNPAVDLSRLSVPIRVSVADVHDGTLTLSGGVAPDDILRLANPRSAP